MKTYEEFIFNKKVKTPESVNKLIQKIVDLTNYYLSESDWKSYSKVHRGIFDENINGIFIDPNDMGSDIKFCKIFYPGGGSVLDADYTRDPKNRNKFIFKTDKNFVNILFENFELKNKTIQLINLFDFLKINLIPFSINFKDTNNFIFDFKVEFCVKLKDIEQIIEQINIEDFDTFLDSNKYNL